MRIAGILGALLLTTGSTWAETVTSAYTELDTQEDCSVFAGAGEEPGDWSNLVCSGYKGYPVFIYYSDARESLFYGFPPAGDLAPRWESFTAFNRAGTTVEWRIASDGVRERPFATIHRWFVTGGPDMDEEIEVLVVEKVGQIAEWQGCAVGYVVASGNNGANEAARRIADEQARGFSCETDEPAVEEGSVPLPGLARPEQ